MVTCDFKEIVVRSSLPIGIQLDDIVGYLRLRERARQGRGVTVPSWSPWVDDRRPS